MEFTPINTQEEFDAAIKDRLSRQEAKIRGEYSGYEDLKRQSEAWQKEKESYEKTISENKTAYEDLNSKLSEATGKIAAYETDALKTKVAIEAGIPMELRDYLNGNNEEEIKASAEKLGKFTKAAQTPPQFTPETDPPKASEDALKQRAFKNMLKDFKGE